MGRNLGGKAWRDGRNILIPELKAPSKYSDRVSTPFHSHAFFLDAIERFCNKNTSLSIYPNKENIRLPLRACNALMNRG